MIEIIIDYKNDQIVSFKVEGHAGYAPKGEDICCAGVSAVTQTAIVGLLKHLELKPDYKIEKGCLACKLPSSLGEKDQEKAQLILSSMEAGLISMQEAYADFIRVSIRRC